MARPAQEPDRVQLALSQDPPRRRGWVPMGVALLLGAAVGGIVGLVAGRTTGLVVAAAVAAAFALLAWSAARRRVWLEGTSVSARTIGTKTVDLRAADRIELMVTDVRGVRTIGLLVGRGGSTINVSLAVYSGTGGRELGILALRRLADALAAGAHSAGLVFSQLLVAQLRAEARGEPAPERPLYRLAATAPQGRIAQRLKPEAVTRFVATLD